MVGGGQSASLREVGRRDVSFGCPQTGHALVEGVGALLNLDFSVGLVGEFGEARVLRILSRRGSRRVPGCERTAPGGERRDREQRHEGLEWVFHECPERWCARR